MSTAALSTTEITLHDALVNILCEAPSSSGTHSISGSGVIIDPKGIILTNAHVAQLFLLADRGVSCFIRSGGPATDRYRAALMFISPAWLNANATVLTTPNPSGTGEQDFALLAITSSLTEVPLPAVFPFVTPASVPPHAGAHIVIASYAAQFLDSAQVRSALFPTIVESSIKDVFTFGTNTIDVLALGGSQAAQEGSSGGGVASADGELVGMITTSTTEGVTSARSLNAITLSYIRTEYAREAGSPLAALLAEPTADAVANFAPHLPDLESVLTTRIH